jgi:HlyD family secretion protein
MNKTRVLRTGLIALLCAVTVPLVSCSLGASNTATAPPATAAVTRGDITTYITASGNLSYPDTQDVRLQISGTVSEVLVQAGDIVKQGDVLVKLDDSAIQDRIKSDQLVINSAKISLEKATNTYKQKTYPYTYNTFSVDIPYAVGSITTAEARVTSARDTLAKAVTLSEMSDAQNQLTNALKDLDDALLKLTFGQGDNLFQVDANGNKIVRLSSTYWDLRLAQLDVQSNQAQLDKVNNDLESDKSDLDKTVVRAPFDGLITNVAATDGAIMNQNNVAVTMTNPSKLEAVVLVNEIDIFNVKINSTASVQADAAQGLTVPATVTYIEPTATVQSGVVNYHVKVELILPTSTNSTQAGRTTAPNRQSGASSAGSSAVSFASLRQGLSVTVNILKENKQNVLLVPNKAIIRQGTATSIQALQSNGTIETRTVQVGASDSRNTEVTQGLNEGDKVIVQSSATRTATPASGFGPFGGMGR